MRKQELLRRWNRIQNAVVTKPYSYYFLFFFLLYLVVNYVTNGLAVTLPTVFDLSLNVLIPFVFFTFFVAILVALNVNLVIIKVKELQMIRQMRKEGSIAAAGMFGGLLAGACPGCLAGLFPAIAGLFGVNASLSVLPLYGAEIQAVSSVLLVISAFLLTRDNTCATL